MPFKIIEVPSSTGKYELRVLPEGDPTPYGGEVRASGITSFVMLGPCNVPGSTKFSVYTLTEVSPTAQNAGTTKELFGTTQSAGTSSSSATL
jgi:hypothetical protein